MKDKNNIDEKIHVAFCIDKNCTIQVLLVINSILINNKSKSKYKFYVIENNLSFFDKLHIKFFIKTHKHEVEILHVDMTDLTKGKDLYSESASQHISNMGCARIFLPKLLPNLEKVLYLDYDILVLDDLKPLWNIDLGNNLLAMTIDPFTNIKVLPKEVTSFSNEFFLEAMKWKIFAGKKYWAKFPDFYFERKEYYNDGIF